MRRLLPVLLCLGVSTCGQKVTGLYMAKDAEGVAILEIVETDDHRVAGRAEFENIGADGQVTDKADVVTGAVGDGVITIELQPRDIISRAMSLSGVLNGNMLTLDGTGSQGHFRLLLTRTSQDVIQAALSDVSGLARAKRRAIKLAQEQVQELKDRDAFIQKVVETSLADDAFTAKQDEVVDKLRRVENAFKSASTQMKAKLGQEAAIYGDGQAEVKRSQLYISANQIALQASQLHLQLTSATQAYQQKVEALDRPSREQEQECHRARPSTAQDPTPPGWELWNTDCLLLRDKCCEVPPSRSRHVCSPFSGGGHLADGEGRAGPDPGVRP